jgi:hypothetical protein
VSPPPGPTGPVAPVAPVALTPVAPVSPVAPMAPVAPVASVAPTPVAPVAPVVPVAPVAREEEIVASPEFKALVQHRDTMLYKLHGTCLEMKVPLSNMTPLGVANTQETDVVVRGIYTPQEPGDRILMASWHRGPHH